MSDKADLLEKFGLMPEEDVATLLGVSIKTLKNRPRSKLPTFTKAGHQRLFYVDSVKEFLQRRSSAV